MELQLNDAIKTGKLPHRKRQAVDYNVTDFNSILMDNLQRITKGYGSKESECIIKDKKICGKLTANTLSKYLEVNIQKALNESYKMDMDSQVPIDLNPKHCFDALLDMYYAYEDGKKEAGAIMDLFKKKLFTICNMHRNNGNLSTNEATDIYNKGVASLEAKLETVTEQFFNQAPMKYEDAVNFMVNNFKAQLSSVVFDANKDLLDGILKQASTSNAERKQKTGVQFDSYLIKTLQDSKKVAETFLDNFLKTSSIGDNKCPFITVDDKKKLMLSTLQKTYYQLLIDSFSGKKLTDDEHPVITPKFVKKINASFEEKAKDVIKNFEKFEKTFMTRFDDVVMRNIKDNVANNEATRLGMAMKQLTNEKDKEALLASMKNGMTNALGFSCNALFKSYLQEPQLYENTKEYVNALLENQVFLANNNFSVAVVDVMDGHYNNTVNALYDEKSGGNLLVSVANEYNEACLEIIKNCENKNYTFEEAQKNGAVKKAGIDEDVFKALHGKIKDKAGIKPYVLDSLAKEIETRVKSNLLFYGMGTIEAAKQRITNEVKAEFKKKLVRFGNFKEVFERLAEPVSHNFSGVPEARRKRLCHDMLIAVLDKDGGQWDRPLDSFMTVQGKGVEKVNEGALKAWIEERFTAEVKDIKKEKIEENQGHIAGVETAYGKFVGYLDKQINAFRDELDKKYPKLKGEVLDYIGEKALKSLRGTFLTNLNNQPEKYQNEETWKDTFDEWTVPNFIRNLCNELATTSFHDVRYVKKFLAGLGEDDSHPEMKVFGDFVKKESESSMKLSKDDIVAIRKRNAQRDQAVNLIRNNVKVWGENLHIQKATVTAQKAVIDRWCERVANIVNKNEEGGIAGLITAQIDEFYKDFKTDILDGIRGMILMVNFNEDMLPAARAAFDKWIVDLNLPGGKDSKTVAELNQLFTERVADLQKRRAVNKDVEEPILTIGFMDKLLKVIDTDGIKEKLKAWKEANMGKYQAFFLDKNNSTKEYMNLNVAVGRELNKNEIAVTKNMDVQAAIQNNKNMMEATLSDIMDSVAEKYVKKQLCFHTFDDGFMADMDKKIDEEVTNRLREIEGKCKTNYSHAVKMATNAYELERQDAFDTMVFYMFGLKQGTFRCNDMQKSLDGLYTVMNNNKGKAWFEGIRAKLGDLKYRDRGNYNIFVPFYQLYDKFVISIEKAIGANIDKFTDPMELTMAMRYARRFFIEKSKMLQTMTTLADNLTKSKDQNDKTWGDDLKEVIKMMRDRLGGFDEDNADAEYQLYKERLGMTDDLLNRVGKENKLNVDDIIKGFTDFEKNLILRRERLLDKNANKEAQQVENK